MERERQFFAAPRNAPPCTNEYPCNPRVHENPVCLFALLALVLAAMPAASGKVGRPCEPPRRILTGPYNTNDGHEPVRDRRRN